MSKTGGESKHVVEFSLKLDSNPEFTASVLIAYARAAYKLSAKGESGARTIFDIPPKLLSNLEFEDMMELL
jgi:diaminopimelate dehydrogenase